MNKLLNVKQTADLLQIHEITLYKMAKVAKIPAFKVGKQSRFDKEDVLKSLRNDIKKGNINESCRSKTDSTS